MAEIRFGRAQGVGMAERVEIGLMAAVAALVLVVPEVVICQVLEVVAAVMELVVYYTLMDNFN